MTPRRTIEQELGSQLPESVEVTVVEESAQTIYLVLPSASPVRRRLASSPIRSLRPWPAARAIPGVAQLETSFACGW